MATPGPGYSYGSVVTTITSTAINIILDLAL